MGSLTRGDWAKIIGGSLAIRAVVALVVLRSMPLVSDAASYVEFATELLADFPGTRAYFWPPGNSLVLAAVFAAFGSSVLVARFVSIGLSVVGVVLAVLLTGRLVDSVRAQRWAGGIAAVYAPAVLLSGQPYAQHLSAVAVLAVAWFGLRAIEEASLRSAALAGIAFGLGCLTRPSMLSVAPFLIVVCILPTVRPVRASKWIAVGGVFAVVSAAFLVPVQLHNARHGGGFTLSTNNERNFFLGNNPYTPDYKTSHLGQRPLEDLDPEARAYLERFYTQMNAREAMKNEAIAFMVSHPGKTALRSVNRATSFWGFDYLAARIIQEHRGWGARKVLPVLALEAGSYVLMLLAIAGFFAFREETSTGARQALVLLVIAYELPYTIAFSGGTYHFPVIGLLIPFAALAAAHVFTAGGVRMAMARLRKSKGAPLALVVFAAIQVQYAYYAIAMKG
jgi:4-amino-4-deoxy-L-arabinose transferase-like glycosyltransferase